jgi:hypothetical protein
MRRVLHTKGLNDGTTPLFAAAQGSHVQVATHLIAAGADVNKVGPE